MFNKVIIINNHSIMPSIIYDKHKRKNKGHITQCNFVTSLPPSGENAGIFNKTYLHLPHQCGNFCRQLIYTRLSYNLKEIKR